MPFKRINNIVGYVIAILTVATMFFAPLTVVHAQNLGSFITGEQSGGEPVSECTGVTSPLACARAAWGALTDFAADIAGLLPKLIGSLVRQAGIIFLSFGSWVLTTSIDYSIGQSLDRFTGIQVGWTVLRDFANLFFIFIILYIAIQTILQLGNHSTKQMLVRVIVVALLINFSGFFTRVVIDAGNIIAVGFYNRILESPAPRGGDTLCSRGAGPGSTCSIADRFSDAISIQQQANVPAGTRLGPIQTMLFYMMSGVMFFILGALFIKGAYFFIARMIAFCFLIMFSPLAFLAYAFPSGRVSKYMDQWWEKLLNYTLLAPFYMIIMYLVLQVVSAPGFLQGTATTSNIMDFILVVALLSAGTNLAFSLADSTGASIANWGSKVTSGVALGALTGSSAYLARQTIGNRAAKRANGEGLQDAINKGGFRGKFAQFRKDQYEKAAKGSWDVSQSKYGGQAVGALGASIPEALQRKGGFDKSGSLLHGLTGRGKITKTQEEAYIKQAKEQNPGDPAAQREFLRNYMGENWDGESNFDTSKTKETKELRGELTRKIREKDVEKALETDIGELDKQREMLVEKNTQLAAAVAAGDANLIATLNADIKTINKNIADRGTAIKMNSRQVRASAIAGFSEKILMSKGFAENVDRTVLSEIHKQYNEGKYQDQDILTKITSNVFASGNAKAQEYLASPEGKKSVLNYNVPLTDVQRTKVYRAEQRLKTRIENQLRDLQARLATETDPEKRYKLEDEIDKKNDRLEKVEENIAVMDS